jgi:hypothetical protein
MFTVGFIVGGDSQPISAILEKETPINYTIYSMVNCPRSDASHPGVLPITIVDPHRWRDFGDPKTRDESVDVVEVTNYLDINQ